MRPILVMSMRLCRPELSLKVVLQRFRLMNRMSGSLIFAPLSSNRTALKLLALLTGGMMLLCSAPLAQAQIAEANELAVQITNKSEPELCAERDNVALEFASPEVRRFRLQAVHPAYIGTIDGRPISPLAICRMIPISKPIIRAESPFMKRPISG